MSGGGRGVKRKRAYWIIESHVRDYVMRDCPQWIVSGFFDVEGFSKAQIAHNVEGESVHLICKVNRSGPLGRATVLLQHDFIPAVDVPDNEARGGPQ